MKKLIFLLLIFSSSQVFAEKTGQDIIKSAFDHMRGETSEAVMEMTIIRPDFKRKFVIKEWTQGEDLGIFYTIAPAKDRGNATLKKSEKMWTYNPKINRVIKLPPSMMSQGWMGSDFSNNDLSKTDSIIKDYSHEILSKKKSGSIYVYEIKSVPRPGAPVVWGMQKLKVTSENIILEQIFYDEDLVPVKTLFTTDIQMMGGRLFPKKWIMKKNGENNRFTEVKYSHLIFNKKLKPNLFSITSLKNLRE